MRSTIFRAGTAAALLWMGAARAEDAQPTMPMQKGDAPMPMQMGAHHDAAHQAMHDAMQQQMATPPAGMTEMPRMQDRATADAGAMKQRTKDMQQVRDAARQRAMRRGAQDAAMAQGGDAAHATMHGTMQQGGGMMGGDASTQQGPGMMRTGDMHGGTGGMMPGGSGGTTGAGGPGGMMGGTTGGTTTPTGTGGSMGSTGPLGGGTTMPTTGTGGSVGSPGTTMGSTGTTAGSMAK